MSVIASMALPMVLAAAAEALRFGVGASQNKAGKKIVENSSRPVDYITNSDKSALMMARQMASLRELPGAAEANESIDLSTSNAIRESKMTGNVDIATIAKSQMGAKNDLSAQTSNMINNNIGTLMTALKGFGALEKSAFNYNEQEKYAENMTMASNLQNSGLQNMFTGVSNVAAAGIGADSTARTAKMIEDLSKVMNNNFVKSPVNENTMTSTPVAVPENNFNAYAKFEPMFAIKSLFNK